MTPFLMMVSVALSNFCRQRTDGKPRGDGSRRLLAADGHGDQATRRGGRLRTNGHDLRPAVIIGNPLHRHHYQKEEGDNNVAPLNIMTHGHRCHQLPPTPVPPTQSIHMDSDHSMPEYGDAAAPSSDNSVSTTEPPLRSICAARSIVLPNIR